MKIFLILELLILGAIAGLAEKLQQQKESYQKLLEKVHTSLY
jgi:hypothetical protein